MVDAAMPREEVAGDAGDGGEGSCFGAEEFQSHEAGGDGGVGCSGKDGDEAHGGEQRRGQREDAGECVAEGGSDEEEWGDLATFEAGAKSERSEGEFGCEVVAG